METAEHTVQTRIPTRANWSFTIRVLAFFGALLLMGCGESKSGSEAASNVEAPARPNILFIMADDHGYQALSAYNHELSQLAPTPNIDRIAQNGALFERAYVTNSICGPSRAVILTGLHSHMNGFRKNGERFDGDQPTLPKMLGSAGYQTALVGKWHLHGHPQGFDYWNIIDDQGYYYNPDFIQQGDTVSLEGYASDLITRDALRWLKEERNDSTPFFMMVQHKAPHRNWMPAPRHLNLYDSVTFPLPPDYFPDFEDQPAAEDQMQNIYRDMYEGYDLKMSTGYGKTEIAHNPWPDNFDRMDAAQRQQWDEAYLEKNNAMHAANLSGKDLDRWKGQRYLRDYMATVAALDESVGQLLDYLEATGLDENTLVVYTSDQGFWLGENGWFDKRFMYEESFRTPLLMQYPGHISPGTREQALVQNLDFAPTFLDYAGIPEVAIDMQGVSFRGLLDDSLEESEFRDAIYYHYYAYPAWHMVKRHYGIRTNRYKLIHFYDDIDSWELYDLQQDPGEKENQADNPDYAGILGEMRRKLDSVQEAYRVTESEFEKAPEENVRRARENFRRLRGNASKP